MNSPNKLVKYLYQRVEARLIAEGKNQTEIAEMLSLGVSTVNTYRSRILEKLELKSDSEIVYFAMEKNLID